MFLEFYSKNKKLLKEKNIQKKIVDGEDIFDKKWKKISKAEKKYILAVFKKHKTGQNFYEKNIFAKTLVLLAGVIMNFLLAWVIFSWLFYAWVQPVWVNIVIPTQLDSKIIPTLDTSLRDWIIIQNEWIILSPVEWSAAEASGVQNGDILIMIDGNELLKISQVQSYVSSFAWEEIYLWILRNDAIIDITVAVPESWQIGTYLSPNYEVNRDFIYTYNLIDSAKYWFYEVYVQSRLTLSWLGLLWKNIFAPETPRDREQALDSVAGPIGIVSVITGALSSGITLLIILSALISVNLGVFNLLPIPALDWWRILLLWIRSFIDSVFGKTSLSWKFENMTHVIFFMILIALSVLIAYNDIVNLFSN